MNTNRGDSYDAHQRSEAGTSRELYSRTLSCAFNTRRTLFRRNQHGAGITPGKWKIDSWRAVHGYVRARHGAVVRARTASGGEREQKRKNKGGVPPRERDRGWIDMGIRRQSWALGILTAAGLVNGRGGADYRSNVVCQAPSTMQA